MSLTRWPVEKYPGSSLRWRRAGVGIGGGPTISGPGQFVTVDGGGWWVMNQKGIVLENATRIAGWRALMLQLDEGAVPFEIPCVDGVVLGSSPLPFSDGSAFSDGSEFISGSGIVATLNANAALRASQIVLDVTAGNAFQGGEAFTFVGTNYGARLYMVHSLVSQSGALQTINIRPTLREAMTAGATADFDQPRCTMQLLPDPQGRHWPEMVAPFEAIMDIGFAESFAPA